MSDPNELSAEDVKTYLNALVSQHWATTAEMLSAVLKIDAFKRHDTALRARADRTCEKLQAAMVEHTSMVGHYERAKRDCDIAEARVKALHVTQTQKHAELHRQLDEKTKELSAQHAIRAEDLSRFRQTEAHLREARNSEARRVAQFEQLVAKLRAEVNDLRESRDTAEIRAANATQHARDMESRGETLEKLSQISRLAYTTHPEPERVLERQLKKAWDENGRFREQFRKDRATIDSLTKEIDSAHASLQDLSKKFSWAMGERDVLSRDLAIAQRSIDTLQRPKRETPPADPDALDAYVKASNANLTAGSWYRAIVSIKRRLVAIERAVGLDTTS